VSENLTYNLYSTERRYREETLISYYFKPNKRIIKKCRPIDHNGERLRLYDDGTIENYKKKEILNSKEVSLRRTTVLMNMLLAMNDFDWFLTLTFDKNKIDRTNAEEVFNCYKKYINNIKKQFPNFKYMTFPERHKDNCFHFHMLVAGLTVQQMGLVNSGKVCCSWASNKNGVSSRSYYEKTKDKFINKDTDGEPIYNVTSFAYGYTTASRIVSRERCNSYVKKYVEKALGSTEIFKKRFYYSSNLNVPEIVKRLVGADFTSPFGLEKELEDNPLYQNAKGKYMSEYEVLQIKVDNQTKDYIDKGLIPLSAEEIEELGEIF